MLTQAWLIEAILRPLHARKSLYVAVLLKIMFITAMILCTIDLTNLLHAGLFKSVNSGHSSVVCLETLSHFEIQQF